MSKKLRRDVRNVEPVCIDVCNDSTTASWSRGEYRQILEITQPWNGKSPRIIRIRLTPGIIGYMREQLNEAEKRIRARMNDEFQGN